MHTCNIRNSSEQTSSRLTKNLLDYVSNWYNVPVRPSIDDIYKNPTPIIFVPYNKWEQRYCVTNSRPFIIHLLQNTGVP